MANFGAQRDLEETLLFPTWRVREALEELLTWGLCYSTVDDDHFLAVSA